MDILSMALALSGGSGSGGASSWNDLTDRPFYVDGTKLESFSTTLTFDGNKAGKEIEPIYGLDTDGEAHYVKVSDGYITTADAVGRTLAMYDMAGMTGTQSANVEWPLTDSVIVPVQDGKVVSIADFVIVVYEECTLHNGSHLTPGVWFGLIEYNGTPLAYVKSISGEFTATRQVENIVKIPDKFINTEWLANTKTTYDEILLDATAVFDDPNSPVFAKMAGFPYHKFTVGEKTAFLVEFNGETYATEGGLDSSSFYLGNLSILSAFGSGEVPDTGEPFLMFNTNNPSGTGDIYMLVKEPPAAPIPVKVVFGRIAPNKLPAKYLPDDHINALIDAKLGVIENGSY